MSSRAGNGLDGLGAASGAAGAGDGSGGAIFNTGTVTLRDVSLIGNSAGDGGSDGFSISTPSGPGGNGGDGGAVLNAAGAGSSRFLPEVVFKQLGVGLAAAVLIDATIVRAVLLPPP